MSSCGARLAPGGTGCGGRSSLARMAMMRNSGSGANRPQVAARSASTSAAAASPNAARSTACAARRATQLPAQRLQQQRGQQQQQQRQRNCRAFSSASSSSAAAAVDASVAGADPSPSERALDETLADHLDPATFLRLLNSNGMEFFTGVPDSLLKDFASYVHYNIPATHHVMTANEGNSIAVAAGYHCATGKIPVVYMQNSGIGNAINPLLSLAAKRVYAIPMLVLVGWRGEPGRRDEPQHMVQGHVLPSMLTSMSIRYDVLPDYAEGAAEALEYAVDRMKVKSQPYVFLVRKGTFEQYKPENPGRVEFAPESPYPMKREDALGVILDRLGPRDCTVATTGFASRELYEVREARNEKSGADFLMVGSMGHATAFALGVGLHTDPDRKVVCIDGDGAALMHTGTMATIGKHSAELKNFKHILINNGAHDSVGGQSSGAFNLDGALLAQGFGYKGFRKAENEDELRDALEWAWNTDGPLLIEVRVESGARKDLGRPKTTTHENKRRFMQHLNSLMDAGQV